MRSASGGAFFELARAFLHQPGTVYGAVMHLDDSHARIVHEPATNEVELSPLQGSKYAQGDAHSVFRQIRELLQQGRRVLFAGLPCQVAGLYGYLGRDWPTLVTADIFCHGNTSEAHLNLYLRYLRDKYHQNIIEYTFRDKHRSTGYLPHLTLANGKTIRMTALQEVYWYLYQNSKFYRESCYSCPYACSHRVGDVSLGDFWGIEQQRPELLAENGGPLDRSCGISVIFANTAKGEALVHGSALLCRECTLEDVIPGGAAVRAPQSMPEDRDVVLALFRDGDYKAVKRYGIRQMGAAYLVDLVYDTKPIKLLRRILGRQ